MFAFLIGPPVEVASVREMGCHNNQGYYDNIVSVDEVEDKLLVGGAMITHVVSGCGCMWAGPLPQSDTINHHVCHSLFPEYSVGLWLPT